ncbi:hypothetical protein [Ruminococcus sp.]|uniref:hypothetical protein n=1 Tax=Ruminococcus sp. TaxID=41978 RepID=UPI00399291BD
MVYITGDMHGDITRFGSDFQKAEGRNVLIVCGGWIIWNSSRQEAAAAKLREKPFTIALWMAVVEF